MEANFLRENDAERILRVQRQESYRKWIIRLKNERIFNLYDCDKYLAKFENQSNIEYGTKAFEEFEKQNANDKLISGNPKVMTKKSSNSHLTDEFWNDIENKANSDEGATFLRRSTEFADQLGGVLKHLLNEEKISDKRLLSQVVKIIVLTLMKGKFDSQHPNLDITKNYKVLEYSLVVFKITTSDEHINLLNDIIKVIGLFAKFSVYFSNGIEGAYCTGFLKYIPNLLAQGAKPHNIQINLLKAIGIMISAASMMTKRSLIFYKTLLDLNIVGIIFNIIKNFKLV